MWVLRKMDESANVRFCGEVEKYPCLYNNTNEEYMRRDATDSAWEEVSKAVGESVSLCKERWRNLRSSYNRSLKKSMEGGSKMLRNYYLKDAMEFVAPFVSMRTKGSGSAIYQPSQPELVQVDVLDEGVAFENAETEGDYEEAPSTSKRKRNSIQHSAFDSSKSDNVDKCIIEYYKSNDAQNSSDMDFFKSLLPDMYHMNDRQKRHFKRKCLDLIDDILIDQPPTISVVKRSPDYG